MAYNNLRYAPDGNDDILETGLYLSHDAKEYQLWYVNEDDEKEKIGWTVVSDLYADIIMDDFDFICMSRIDSVYDMVDVLEVN